VIKNYDPLWVYLDLASWTLVSMEHYIKMETLYSGLDFHLYIVDYDGDGALDIVYPD